MPHASGHDEDHRALLRDHGLRATPTRLAVLRALCSTRRAVDAQRVADMLKRSGKPDRVTVYRTLNSLVEAGIAHRVDPGDRVFRFGLAGDHAAHARPAPAGGGWGVPHADHPHFVCNSCGTVECLDDAEVVIRPGRKSEAAARRVTQREVLLHGTCEDCSDNA